MKKNYLTKLERLSFTLSSELKDILIGLLLGDLYIHKQKTNARLEFTQGIVHKEYIQHLYELFIIYCGMVPKTTSRLPDKRTGKVYSSVLFKTFALPCFNELLDLFYVNGVKVVPSNIFELLTPLGLCYWICDDGGFSKRDRALTLNTQGFTLKEMELLCEVLRNKFGLKCSINKCKNSFTIRISAKSTKDLQSLLKDIMPSMMLHKIGL